MAEQMWALYYKKCHELEKKAGVMDDLMYQRDKELLSDPEGDLGSRRLSYEGYKRDALEYYRKEFKDQYLKENNYGTEYSKIEKKFAHFSRMRLAGILILLIPAVIYFTVFMAFYMVSGYNIAKDYMWIMYSVFGTMGFGLVLFIVGFVGVEYKPLYKDFVKDSLEDNEDYEKYMEERVSDLEEKADASLREMQKAQLLLSGVKSSLVKLNGARNEHDLKAENDVGYDEAVVKALDSITVNTTFMTYEELKYLI